MCLILLKNDNGFLIKQNSCGFILIYETNFWVNLTLTFNVNVTGLTIEKM